jgi:predicted aminopeptidase
LAHLRFMKKRWLMATGLSLLGSLVVAALTTAVVCAASGCSTLGYYAQSVGGHLSIVRAAKPVSEWLADAQTSSALKERLALSQRIRDYAVSELKEPNNASYRRFADLKRASAVWNVVATPELSLTLKTWCFPVVGCVGYRGYYDQVAANEYANTLRAQGLEVNVYGVPAYSTLGLLPFDVFADPLLNTFINYPEAELVRLIFHELAHQVAFAKGDTTFNESFATAVERIGSTRWLKDRASQADQQLNLQALQEFERQNARKQDFQALTARFRARLAAIYAQSTSDADKRVAKQTLMAELKTEYEALKRDRWAGYAGYDGWFAKANNASFAVLSAYNELAPNFERLFERQNHDFTRFYAEVKRLAALPAAERRAELP